MSPRSPCKPWISSSRESAADAIFSDRPLRMPPNSSPDAGLGEGALERRDAFSGRVESFGERFDAGAFLHGIGEELGKRTEERSAGRGGYGASLRHHSGK